MSTSAQLDKLKSIYDEIALTKDEKTTACDFNLRELEIDCGLDAMTDGDRILDVGCGLGYAVRKYASVKKVEAYGIDYSANMISGANMLHAEAQVGLLGTAKYAEASVMDIPFPDGHFDVVTSSRCLMALLDWERQKSALQEIARVLKQGGTLVLMEGTYQGLHRLNEARRAFGLDAIDDSGRDRLLTLKFDEPKLVEFCSTHFQINRIQRFGMYYFLTRVVHPLLVAPDTPRYDARINSVALEVARKYPDYKGMGHLVAFVLEKTRSDTNKE